VDKLSLGRFQDLLPMETGALRNLVRNFLREVFNPQTPDHPSVHYLSYTAGAHITNPLNPLLLPHRYMLEVEGANDGLVSVESARWGTVIRQLDLCHASQIGWTPRDVRSLYRELMAILADEGH
jgi:triacylglycerol lipase